MWIRAAAHRGFRTYSGGSPMRLRGSRGGGRGGFRGSNGGGSTYLLDKFVKQFTPNGSLILRCPFNVKVRGSYFDKANNVDRLKNKRVTEEIFNESPRDRSPENEEEESVGGSNPLMIEKLSQTLESLLPPPPHEAGARTPLHFLIYGRLSHRIDSYSIVDAAQRVSTHVYLTDSGVEAETLLTQRTINGASAPPPDGLLSLLTPNIILPAEMEGKKLKELLQDSKTPGENESLSSSFKLYAAKHIRDANNSGIKTVFLIPTVMNKIYLQGEGASSLELDASLIHKVDSVGMTTEFGNISVRDLVSDDIRLASHMGDVISEGNLDGHIVVETKHDGDFLASHVDGPSLLVNTEEGDINVLGTVNSDVSQFYTRNGHIFVRHLSNQSYMLVRDSGSINGSVEQGFLTAVVKTGSIQLRIDSLSADSSLQVENGEITLRVRKDRNFRISSIAQHTNLSPQIANQGDLSVNEETLHETFLIEPTCKGSSVLPSPILKVEVLQGTLNLSFIPEDEESSSSNQSETRKST
eukprot:TRINITY_DN2662_c0_g1_i1.p1 TRINITY_DN2662_c0_g1~~TRINITY_DN2662_c0_g1_i1.p1  ORF type:complete len:525 (-),score=186.21 TRINITY_DN2662_c0_g1_i1:116-1690(-)